MTASKRERLVVIGNGMAPGRALEKLFELCPERYDVTIFNAEPRVNYDRIMLSPVLSGEKSFEDIVIHGDTWYVKNGVRLLKGERITEIDRVGRMVTSQSGIVAPYDKLIIATGSAPVIIPVPGHNLAGVLTYRDLDDVNAMLIAAKAGGNAVVIGGGLLGLEAAAGLKAQGMAVTVLHLMPTLMERQLDPAAGGLLEKALEAKGITVQCRADTAEITGDARVSGVLLKDGTHIPADIVIMAVGIRPNAALARSAGLDVNRGIVVTPEMRSSDPDIFAIGECAESHGQVFGLVAPLYEMATIAARQLAGDATARFSPAATATKLKVTGIDVYSAGDFADDASREEIVLRDPAQGIYKRLILKDNRVLGAVMYGETGDGPWFFNLIKKATDVAGMRGTLIFGQEYQDAAPLAAPAHLAAVAHVIPTTGPAA